MNLTKCLLFFLFTLFIAFKGLSQYTGNEKKYTIQKIDLLGSNRFSKQTVLSYANIREGVDIIIPGDRVREAIAKLWSTGLFKQVDIYASKIEGDKIWLEVQLVELSRISDIIVMGVKKKKKEKIIQENNLEKARTYITDNLLVTTKNNIEKTYKEKGFLNAEAKVYTKKDTSENGSILAIDISRGERVKVGQINFQGNELLRSRSLRAKMKNTRQKNLLRLWKPSRFDKEKYDQDLISVIDRYKELGFRDARILSDTTYLSEKNQLVIDIEVEEGKRYYFRYINWVGNSIYSTEILNNILSYEKGDPYDVIGFQNKLSGDNKNRDIHTLYLDNGYLFSTVRFVEKAIEQDSIDVEIQINEDAQARINKVTVTGNGRTNDHVIYREIRTKPGDLFSKTQLQRTYREIAQLGFFDAEKIGLEPKPNYQNKTVDIDISVEETGSSQIELSGGYGGGRFLGSLGFSFNNFALGRIFDKKAWKPLPIGDGQKLSVRAQATSSFQSYSFSFTEPWLGGRKPNSFTTSLYYTRQRGFNRGALNIIGVSFGLGRRLTWPDDFFTLSQSINLQRYELDNYFLSTFSFQNGFSNNINYTLNFGRNSSGPNPIYPTRGSSFNIQVKFTPPYSLFGDREFEREQDRLNQLRESNASNQDIGVAQQDLAQARLKLLEFYKFKFESKWYKSIAKNLVVYIGTEFGILGAYNSEKGISPFERFYIGGTGLISGRFDGREAIALRGYEDASTNGGILGQDITPTGGGVLYNKFLMELRYPITLSPSASIYMIGFLEAGNAYDGVENFQPFELKRSAGVGVRIFMPAFGLLGLDFAYGFDPVIGQVTPSRQWMTHFIFGQQF